MRKADKNDDNKMTLKEVKNFLRHINIEVDDTYAEMLFVVRTLSGCKRETQVYGNVLWVFLENSPFHGFETLAENLRS